MDGRADKKENANYPLADELGWKDPLFRTSHTCVCAGASWKKEGIGFTFSLCRELERGFQKVSKAKEHMISVTPTPPFSAHGANTCKMLLSGVHLELISLFCDDGSSLHSHGRKNMSVAPTAASDMSRCGPLLRSLRHTSASAPCLSRIF